MKRAWLALVVACSSHHDPEVAPPPPPTPITMKPPAPRLAPGREPIAPWSLTASDGSGLELKHVDARAVVEGPLAFTELHLTFRNPEDRVREGTFAIALPDHAAVSRFAMFEDDHYKEAEVVPTALARRAYDDAIHANIDPAIFEKGAGNQFTARVFPIPANGEKELIISYSQELTGVGYMLPLRGLPAIGKVDVTLQAGAKHEALHQAAWQPDRDFWVDVATSSAIASDGVVAAAFPVQPVGGVAADPLQELTLLVDTSASRAPGFTRYAARVKQLVQELAVAYPQLVVEIDAFDQDTAQIYKGPAAGFTDEAALVQRGANGASDLERAVAVVKPKTRIAIITDGVVTAGQEAVPLYDTWTHAMPARVDVLLAGGIRDDKMARSIVRAGEHAGDVFDFDQSLATIEQGLGEHVRIDVPVEVANATWYYPHVIPSVRAGTQVMVYARVQPQTTFAATIGGAIASVNVTSGTPALVERAATGAEISELETALEGAATDALQKEIEKKIETRSVASRVVSSQATMLILDSDREYAKYGIDRKALADVLVVGKGGLEQLHRTFVASKDRTPGKSKPGYGDYQSLREASSVGMGGGYASFGSGRGMLRSRMASVPTIRIGQPMVMGSLDKNFIRRYVHRYTEKITYCYEHELLSRPHLYGTVQTRFMIDPDGHTSNVTATGFDDVVAACVKGVIEAMEFPAVDDGHVVVNYPFTFRSENTPPDPADAPPASKSSLQVARELLTSPMPATEIVVPVPAVPTPPQIVVPESAAVSNPAPAAPYDAPAAPPQQPIDTMPRFDPAVSALHGKLAHVMAHVRDADALAYARAWRLEQPTDVLAIIALGEALEARKDTAEAARVYGSLIDLYPSRADYRRFAGERLERIGDSARWLAIDTYRRAEADRPDHLTGHRLLAYALVRAGDYAGALDAILRGVEQKHPDDRYRGADRVLRRDAGMIAAAAIAHGGDAKAIDKRLAKHDIEIVHDRSLRAILYWETDANDVDLHIRDVRGNHAWYGHLPLDSGGELYADITTGYGPECFEVTGAADAGPYQFGVHYYRQGPMGYGMGLVQIVRFDGKSFTFDDRPYIIMRDEAYVSLGTTP
ncbi:MAG: VIT domain-containing protein [Kofleriaceae bacterium]